MPYAPLYKVGDRVMKIGHGYGGPGTIVAMFQNPTGAWRFVVAHRIAEGKGEFYHIYGANNLTRREE